MKLDTYKTSEEWMSILYPDHKLKKPLGWDKDNFAFSFYKEKISEQEFNLRILESIIE